MGVGVGALWCSGSRSRLAIRRSGVRIPLGAYALRQGILSTIVSLDPGVVNGLPSRNLFLQMLLALKGCMRAKAGVIMPRAHRDAIWMWDALYKNGTLLLLLLKTCTLDTTFQFHSQPFRANPECVHGPWKYIFEYCAVCNLILMI